jgi:hypothetical protein
MGQTVDIQDDLLYPGDTIRFDYELRTPNETITGEAVSAAKKAIATDDRLDYQGSETEDRVDLETGKIHSILSIYASVRKTRREQRGEIQYVVLSTTEAQLRVVAAVWASSITFLKSSVVRGAQWAAATAQDVATTGKTVIDAGVEGSKAVVKALPTLTIALLLIAAVVFYKFFLGDKA